MTNVLDQNSEGSLGGPLFKAVLQDPNMLVGVLSPKGRLLEANETALQYVKEEKEEVLGTPFWETPWWPQSMKGQVRENVKRAARGEYVEYEADLTDGTGGSYSVKGTIRPVEGGEGSVGGLIVSARDVTEKKEAERQRKRIAEAMDAASSGIAILDEEGTYVYMNRAHAEIFGYDSPEPFLGNSWRMCYTDAQAVRVEEEFLPVLFDEGEWSGEIPGQRKDGTLFPQQVTLTRLGDNGIICVTRDITRRKKRENQVRGRRQKVEALYEAARHLLRSESTNSVSDRILQVLRGVFDLPFVHVGLLDGETVVPQETAQESLSRPPITSPQPTKDDLVVTRALRAGEAVVIDDTGDLRNDVEYGSLSALAGIPIGKRGAVVIGEEGEGSFDQFDLHLIEVLTGYAALVLGRLERESALREAKEEAEQAAHLKSTMLANMSHEIRTPLTSIIGFAETTGEEIETLKEEIEEGEFAKLEQFAALIEDSGQRLLETLNGILNLSKLEAGRMELASEPVDLAAGTERVAEEFRQEAEKKGLRLAVDTDGRPVWARADNGGVQIILQNLLSNAIKYTDSGAVEVRVYKDETEAVVEVEDTGVGMDTEVAETVFEPFRQASEGIGREYGGAGIGLAVTKQAVEQMGGRIELETKKGKGSRFTVGFPQPDERIPEGEGLS